MKNTKVKGKLKTENGFKNLAIAVGFFLFPFTVFLFPSLVFAQSRLTYPISDLGYCRDAKECALYCEIPQNKAACWSWGKYKLESRVLGVTTMSEEERRMMETKAKQYNITFPIADLGNCAGPQECRDFCEEPSNQTTCMAFAKKKGFDKEMERPGGEALLAAACDQDEFFRYCAGVAYEVMRQWKVSTGLDIKIVEMEEDKEGDDPDKVEALKKAIRYLGEILPRAGAAVFQLIHADIFYLCHKAIFI